MSSKAAPNFLNKSLTPEPVRAEVNWNIAPMLSANSLTSFSLTCSFPNKSHLFPAIPITIT